MADAKRHIFVYLWIHLLLRIQYYVTILIRVARKSPRAPSVLSDVYIKCKKFGRDKLLEKLLNIYSYEIQLCLKICTTKNFASTAHAWWKNPG